MKKIKWVKILICIFMIPAALTLTGCADHTVRDRDGKTPPIQSQVQENEKDDQKDETQKQPAESGVTTPKPETEPDTGSDTEAEIETGTEQAVETDTESAAQTDTEPATQTGTKPAAQTTTDDYGPVKVSQIDYDSFQSRMTEEEWAGLKQYFPVLKENAAFELTGFGNYTRLDKNGEAVENDTDAVFYRYDPEEVTDLGSYVKAYAEDDIEEMMIQEVRVFDLDGDGIQELILEWTPVGDFLVLHCENEHFYGWEIMYRGFEALQTNGVYISSGGAASNRWKRIRYENGSWIEEILADADWGEYYIGGEAVDENTFWQQIAAYETEDVTGYKPTPARCASSLMLC